MPQNRTVWLLNPPYFPCHLATVAATVVNELLEVQLKILELSLVIGSSGLSAC